MGLERSALREKRAVERIPVFHRTRAIGPEGIQLSLVIVDLSANGLMARCETSLAHNARLRVYLPKIGGRTAEVRWSLGGRIGCELIEPIELNDYYKLLTALAEGR